MELRKCATSSSAANDTQQMHALRDRLDAALRIADQLVSTPVAAPSHQGVTERYIRNLLKLRRNRDRFFRSELFADPAWDILLELYGAELGQYRMSVSNLCMGAAVPATTALRWIKQLEDDGLLDRRADPTDARRTFVELTQKGIEAMGAYFKTVPVATPVI